MQDEKGLEDSGLSVSHKTRSLKAFHLYALPVSVVSLSLSRSLCECVLLCFIVLAASMPLALSEFFVSHMDIIESNCFLESFVL